MAEGEEGVEVIAEDEANPIDAEQYQQQQMHEQHEGAPPDGAMSGDGVGAEMEEEGGHSIEMENEQMDDAEGQHEVAQQEMVPQ